ncbi:MAG: hypothetical protein WBX15_10435 [Thermoanaerobaculia bacterium]
MSDETKEVLIEGDLMGSAERGWPIERLGAPEIFLSEGRIGALSIHDTRADVERILGVTRRSLWGVRREPKPPVTLQLVFFSDEECLYDRDEMLMKVEEINLLTADAFESAGCRTHESIPIEPLLEEMEMEECPAPEEDHLIDLALDWTDVDGATAEGAVPSLVLPDGSRLSCASLQVSQLVDALGEPSFVDGDEEVMFYEWWGPDFLIVASADGGGPISNLGFSRASLRGDEPESLPS